MKEDERTPNYTVLPFIECCGTCGQSFHSPEGGFLWCMRKSKPGKIGITFDAVDCLGKCDLYTKKPSR